MAFSPVGRSGDGMDSICRRNPPNLATEPDRSQIPRKGDGSRPRTRSSTGMKVLIADDHKLMLEGVKKALSDAGDFEVVGEAQNGAQVMPLVNRLRPEMVLLDLRMPQMDGLQCLSEIKAKYPETKVVILSVSTDPDV